jgi:hypothetical protein
MKYILKTALDPVLLRHIDGQQIPCASGGLMNHESLFLAAK